MTVERTPNYKLPIPATDSRGWRVPYKELAVAIDAALSQFLSINSYQGVWQNSTAYTVGQVVLDQDLAAYYKCLVAHTSAASPTTFQSDRTTNQTYWETHTPDTSYRGVWATNTEYSVGDFVISGTTPATAKFAQAATSHLSGSDFDTDVTAGKWTVLVQGSSIASLSDGDIDNLSMNMQDKNLKRSNIIDYSLESTSPVSAGGTLELNLENGNDFTITLTENISTLSVINWPASGVRGIVYFQLTQDATGGRTVAFPAGWKWSGVIPVMSSAANAVDEFTAWSRDGGTTVYAGVVGQGFV